MLLAPGRPLTAPAVEQGAFVLPLVPHATEDGTRVETDAETDEERDQRYDHTGRAVALLSRCDLIRKGERGDDSETGKARSGRNPGGKEPPYRDLAVQERRPPPEERGTNVSRKMPTFAGWMPMAIPAPDPAGWSVDSSAIRRLCATPATSSMPGRALAYE